MSTTYSSPGEIASGFEENAVSHVRSGTSAFRRISVAFFLAGFATFALLYCVQPLLPLFARYFDVLPATSSLPLSLTLGCLALSIMVMGALSQQLGRKGLMLASMLSAAALNLIASIAPDWNSLLLARALEGVALGGLPAVAMAYLAEEIDPDDLPKAMGIYIAGTSVGAMLGRVGMGSLSEFVTWQQAMEVLGMLCLLAAVGFALLLPPSRNFARTRHVGLGFHLQTWMGHLRNPALQKVYGLGFCLTGVFSTVYNYLSFRLFEPPYNMSPFTVSLMFLLFLFGTVASGYTGALTLRFGARRLLIASFALTFVGVLITLPGSLISICVGIALITIGFFIGHSVASGLVGLSAKGNKGHASSLYLLFYYMGASLVGYVGGWFWHLGQWSGLTALTCLLALAAIVISMRLRP
ncbi:MFS transporter [uncultured Cohaesibacter sp.]|uniref:MFS transporter n=1 Tax=uncultured Cohaesibacter sp. TaxID=1002546 RepID=UPI0029C666A4|nr:MFS transporter [uncultured Cohaesibacter sp.]